MTIISAKKRLIVEIIDTGKKRPLTIRFGIPHWLPSRAEACCHVDWDWLTDDIRSVSSSHIYNKGEDTFSSLVTALSFHPPLCLLLHKYRFFSLSGESLFPNSADSKTGVTVSIIKDLLLTGRKNVTEIEEGKRK